MASSSLSPQENPLAVEKVSKLIAKFGIPSIVSFLVSALYNIVDQIFIGQGVGMLGNAATNVAFPLSTIATSLALLIGIGGAANFNLSMGRGDQERAGYMAGNAISFWESLALVWPGSRCCFCTRSWLSLVQQSRLCLMPSPIQASQLLVCRLSSFPQDAAI